MFVYCYPKDNAPGCSKEACNISKDFKNVRTAELIEKSYRIAGFTGVGVSTALGISDYRSKGGLWNRLFILGGM